MHETLNQLREGLAPAAGILALAAVASLAVSRALKLLAARGTERQATLLRFVASLARTAILLVGLICALGTLGVDVSAIVAGLGLTGFALGFALKDVIANAVSGMLLIFLRPFDLGDRIEVLGSRGDVCGIDLRYVSLRDGEATHLVPNSACFANKVTRLPPEPEDAQSRA